MYKEMLEKAKTDGTLKDVTAHFWIPRKKGDSLIGKLLKVDTVEGNFGKPYIQYTLETDDGLQITGLGKFAAACIDETDSVGKVYFIEYLGKGKSKAGRDFNEYSVKEISE